MGQTLLDTIDFILDEWDNFLERIGRGESTGDAELQENSSDALELRFWVSYRGQTLARTGVFLKLIGIGYEKLTCHVSLLKTYMAAYWFLNDLYLIDFDFVGITVRGMMYYRKALMLQSYLERRSLGGMLLLLV